jgi:hypothetical protein
MDRRNNILKTQKLLKFALETGFDGKKLIELDIDLHGDSEILDFINIFVKIKFSTDTIGMEISELTDILVEQENVLKTVFKHPNLQFKHDGSLGKRPVVNYLDILIRNLTFDDDYFETDYLCVLEMA